MQITLTITDTPEDGGCDVEVNLGETVKSKDMENLVEQSAAFRMLNSMLFGAENQFDIEHVEKFS